MTTCTSCGNDVTGKKFCPYCGASTGNMIGYHTPAPLTCARCGRQNDPGVYICNNCGGQLHQQQPASYPGYHQPPYGYQVPVAPGVHGVPGQPQMVLCCPTCRTLWVVGTPYCQSCHSNLIGVVPTPVYTLSHPSEMHGHHHHGQHFPHGKHKKHGKHGKHGHSGPLDGMGGMLAAGAGGLVGGMILGEIAEEVIEEIFDDD